MANVIVEVSGRPYTMQCPDGEEEHLRDLAQVLDTEVTRLKQSVGSVGDIRLLVMSGIMVADRLFEAIRRIEALELELAGMRKLIRNDSADFATLQNHVAGLLNTAAARLEAATRDLN